MGNRQGAMSHSNTETGGLHSSSQRRSFNFKMFHTKMDSFNSTPASPNENSLTKSSTGEKDVKAGSDKRRKKVQRNETGESTLSNGSSSIPANMSLMSRENVPKDEKTRSTISAAIAKHVLFSHLNEKERQDIYSSLFPIFKRPEDIIIQQGDAGDNFYIIEEGTVDIFVHGNYISSLHAGDSFGELALIYGTPRAATVIAKSELKLWGIDRDSYRRILMGTTLGKRKMHEQFLAKISILDKVDRWERLTIADALEVENYAQGEEIFHQGDVASKFYIIMEGEAQVRRNTSRGDKKSQVISTLGPSQYFGEVALLLNCPRTATIVAKTELKCVTLEKESFLRHMQPCFASMRQKVASYKHCVSRSQLSSISNPPSTS